MKPPTRALHELVGRWVGDGVGFFPTIDDFSYRETLVIEAAHQDAALLRYSQTTWKQVGDIEAPSHVETGFIGITEEGLVEMFNAQGVDRIAALSGSLTTLPDTTGSGEAGPQSLVMHLTSDLLAKDDRMVSSWRTWTLTEDTLSYEMGMRTTAVSEEIPHLRATLHRT
ncbi:MAG: FABP family protein [Acidimicrobiia bacterium]